MSGTRHRWTAAEDAVLRRFYPSRSTAEVAAMLSFSCPCVYNRAWLLGLHKSPAYCARLANEATQRLTGAGVAHRFTAGFTPHNKGQKNWWHPGRSVATRFKRGNRPHTWRPVGSVRVCADGYQQRKMSATGNVRRDWVSIHVLKWRRYRGPIPRGHAISFKDGNKANFRISNLELVSRAELMRRNAIHRLPEELKQVIRAVSSLKRQLKKESSGKK